MSCFETFAKKCNNSLIEMVFALLVFGALLVSRQSGRVAGARFTFRRRSLFFSLATSDELQVLRDHGFTTVSNDYYNVSSLKTHCT